MKIVYIEPITGGFSISYNGERARYYFYSKRAAVKQFRRDNDLGGKHLNFVWG